MMGDGIVGRRRELAALRAWLAAARDRGGRLVLCVGEPGIGKTRLAQEFAGVALAGGTAVACGRCVEAEGAPAYWPWRQVLRSLGVDPDTVLAGDAESPADRFRVFDEVTEAVRGAAGRSGLVVVLDDVHWGGDEPSLLVLRHLGDEIAGARLLVFAAFRDVEPASALPGVLPDLLRSAGVERLDLRGFVKQRQEVTVAFAAAAHRGRRGAVAHLVQPPAMKPSLTISVSAVAVPVSGPGRRRAAAAVPGVATPVGDGFLAAHQHSSGDRDHRCEELAQVPFGWCGAVGSESHHIGTPPGGGVRMHER